MRRRHQNHLVLGIGLLTALTALTTAATDGPDRLAVLPILLGAAPPISAADVFGTVDRASTLRRGVRPMTLDDYYFHNGQELTRRTLRCGSDTRCMSKALAPFGANLGLIVLVNAELAPPLVSLFLLDERSGDSVGQWAGQIEGGQAAILKRLESELAGLLDTRGYPRSGRIEVSVEPRNTILRVGESTLPDLGTQNIFTLLPGQYDVHGTAEGFEPGRVSVSVTAGAKTESRLQLRAESSIWTSPWLWAAVGVVVAGAATATTLALTRDDTIKVCLLAVDGDCSDTP